MKNKINKEFIISIIIPIIIGLISGLISMNGIKDFSLLKKPFLAPPSYLFPIAWTILYTLMGISSYLIYEENDVNTDCCLKIYFLNLFVNLLWLLFATYLNLSIYLLNR